MMYMAYRDGWYKDWVIGALSAVFLFLFSCADDTPEKDATERVVLIYLACDNSLSGEGYQKLEALSLWPGKPGCRLLVYLDTSDAVPRLIELPGKGKRNTIKSYAELNSATGDTFARVLSDVKSTYPSPSYGLVLFSHASGWLPEEALPSSGTAPIKLKSLAVDGNKEMGLIEFAQAIPDKSFGFMIFESCFMAGIETAYQLRNKTGYILASPAEILSPGFTPLYSAAVSQLFEGPAGLQSFAQRAFDYWDTRSADYRSMTLSLVRTDSLESLAAFIRQQAHTQNPVDVNQLQHFDRYTSYHLFFDFEDYYARLIPDQTKKQQLAQLLSQVVIWKAATPSFMSRYNGFDIDRHSGITTYILQQQFAGLNDWYKQLDWYKDVYAGGIAP